MRGAKIEIAGEFASNTEVEGSEESNTFTARSEP